MYKVTKHYTVKSGGVQYDIVHMRDQKKQGSSRTARLAYFCN